MRTTALLLFMISVIAGASKTCGQSLAVDSAIYWIEKADQLWHEDIELAQQYASRAYQLSRESQVDTILASANIQMGIAFYSDAKYDSALEYYDKGLKLSSAAQKADFIRYKVAALRKLSKYQEAIRLLLPFIQEKESRNYSELLKTYTEILLQVGLTSTADSTLAVLQNSDSTSTIDFQRLRARYFFQLSQFDSALSLIRQENDNIGNDDMELAMNYHFMVENFMSKSSYDSALIYLNRAEKIFERLDYQYGLSENIFLTGVLKSYLGDYEGAVPLFLEAFEVFKEKGNIDEMIRAQYELGWVFYSRGLYKRALQYLNQALVLTDSVGQLRYSSAIHNAIASVYFDEKQYDSALQHYDQAIQFARETGNEKELAASTFNKGLLLEQMGDTRQALKLYLETQKSDERIGNLLGVSQGDLTLGKVFLKMEMLDSALYHLDRSERISKEIGNSVILSEIYEIKSNVYRKKGNTAEENRYLRLSLRERDSLARSETARAIAEVETRFDVKNKEQRLKVLRLEKMTSEQALALSERKIERQSTLLWVLGLSLLLLIIVIYLIYKILRDRTKANKKLQKLYSEIQEKQEEILAQSEEIQEANDQVNELNIYLENKVEERTRELKKANVELDKFFYRAAHDFRGPLTTLMGLADLSKMITKDEKVLNIFHNVDLTAIKLDKMVKKLQSISLLSHFDELPPAEPLKMISIINRVKSNFQKELEMHGVSFTVENTVEQTVYSYPSLLETCLENLIENAIIYNNSNPKKVKLICILTNEIELILTVKDNGRGINEDERQKIFEMFHRSSEESKGNGLGLYIVKKVAERTGAEIKVNSKPGKGSEFIFKIPVSV